MPIILGTLSKTDTYLYKILVENYSYETDNKTLVINWESKVNKHLRDGKNHQYNQKSRTEILETVKWLKYEAQTE